MGAFMVVMLGKTADEAWRYFEGRKFTPFRDASTGPCSYPMTVKEQSVYLVFLRSETA